MAVGWTNVFLHVVLKGPPPIPILGEGFATGFNGGIELIDFKLGFSAKDAESGNRLEHAKAAIGMAKSTKFTASAITLKKRFDSSSPVIMYAIDHGADILAATISVTGMLHTGKPIHEPGFLLVLEGCRFLKITTKIEEEGRGAAVIDEIQMRYTGMVMTYLRETVIGGDFQQRIPTAPFIFKKNWETI